MEPTTLPAGVSYTTDQAAGDVLEAAEPLIRRRFTKAGEDPFDTVEWSVRDAWEPGHQSYMKDVEAPEFWSQQAVNITAKLYLSRGSVPETSVRQLVKRVATKIMNQGLRSGYFSDDDAEVFYDELVYICLHQMATFNSPVWFNIGRHDRQQCPSACFLLGVDDTSESIMKWTRDETFIFKAGSGASANISRLRGAGEALSTGGSSSGPVSFMRLPNTAAETFKSGGTTRRAARMVQMDVDHPDVVDFIECKVREEERLRVLGEAGHDIGLGQVGERNVAEATSYQSANNSVRVTDEFMQRATDPDGLMPWMLVPRKGGPHKAVNASDLLDKMADAAHVCADPGLIFHDTVNAWHTTPTDGPIRVSNACSETHLPDDSSCNLGALNIVKFLDEDGGLLHREACHVVDVMTTAMDILVEFCELPTERLVERTKRYRWLGLGCSNMGAAIMSKGLAYDSDAGRDFAASVMALITGRCYRQSTALAHRMGPFGGYQANEEPMLDVIRKHISCLPWPRIDLWEAASRDWNDALSQGSAYGFRNAQASVIAPGGTTSFFMDCDTTGIEPTFSLVQYKDLAGGGSMVLVNQSVARALEHFGYVDINMATSALVNEGVDAFKSYIKLQHLDVFAGANEISADGHIKMLAAVQPWLSGAASKTINLPSSATPDDIRECFMKAWKLGIKCIAVYRDGSKARQVLSTAPKEDVVADESAYDSLSVEHAEPEGYAEETIAAITGQPIQVARPAPVRRRLPRTRTSRTHKIHIRSSMGEHEGYISAGMYADGTLGEVFMEGFGRMGGFVQNALSAWSTSWSIALQYGVPFEVQVRKHVGHSDETGGIVVPDKDGPSLVIRSCDSIIDYIARWLVSEFGSVDLQEELGVMTDAVKARKMEFVEPQSATFTADGQPVYHYPGGAIDLTPSSNGHAPETIISAQACPSCRTPMQRTGTCLTCPTCAYSSGGCG